MRIRNGYSLRKVLDMYIVIGTGAEAYMPNCIMSVNETGSVLWNKLESDAEEADLVQALLDEYDVTAEQAKVDVSVFLQQLHEKDLIAV